MRIELFTTSTEPEFAQDCEAVQLPNTSALATVDHNASIATGTKIIQRLERPTIVFLRSKQNCLLV